MRFPLNGPKDDRVEAWYVKDYESYVRLFAQAEEKAIGEASADTLYFYEGSVPAIKHFLGRPKIIIILRNPVKRAFSAYQHLVRDGRENLGFEQALEAEQQRIEDNWELIYHYTAVSKYYTPVKAFLENFPKVKIIFNEDLEKNTDAVLSEVLEFLEVNPAFTVDNTIRYNQSGKPRSQLLHNLLWEENNLRKLVRPLVRMVLPTQKAREKITNKIMAQNFKTMSLQAETKAKLIKEFEPDVHKLEGLLNKDFSHWLA